MSSAFHEFLQANRDQLNARFLHERGRRPTLDADQFMAFLRETAQTVLTSSGATGTDASRLALGLYELGLDLVAQGLAGPAARHGWITVAWQTLAKDAAQWLIAQPRQMLTAFGNAAHRLATIRGGRPAEFLHRLGALTKHCQVIEQVLALGQVLAWQAGLAQYRVGGLRILRELPIELVARVLGSESPAKCAAVLAAMTDDPWFDPRAVPAAAKPRVTAKVGGFRGLGHDFWQPPRVYAADQRLVAHCQDHHWLLSADCYGATWHACAPLTPSDPCPIPVRTEGSRIEVAGHWFDLAGAGPATSMAYAQRTLAVSTADSHQVWLFGGFTHR